MPSNAARIFASSLTLSPFAAIALGGSDKDGFRAGMPESVGRQQPALLQMSRH
jgi:hypothetical protein